MVRSGTNAKRNLTEEYTGEEPSRSPRIKTPRISRRNLGEELALQEPSIQRTTSWVADLAKSTNELLEGYEVFFLFLFLVLLGRNLIFIHIMALRVYFEVMKVNLGKRIQILIYLHAVSKRPK